MVHKIEFTVWKVGIWEHLWRELVSLLLTMVPYHCTYKTIIYIIVDHSNSIKGSMKIFSDSGSNKYYSLL